MEHLTLVCGWIICGFVGLLGATIIVLIVRGRIDLSRLISEPNGDASLSRFQFLVFTFVIALSLFLIIVAPKPPAFPVIPPSVLGLLGISGGSYLVSKGIQFSDPAGLVEKTGGVVVSPSQAVVRYGSSQQFTAQVSLKPNSTVKWAVTAGGGTISASGLYTAPAIAPDAAAHHATIQATSADFPDKPDVAVITLS
jgi:hypothetical protein